MRVQPRSTYFKIYRAKIFKEVVTICQNNTWIDSNLIKYKDARIAERINAVRLVHSIFSSAGYRHSDAAMFASFLHGTDYEQLSEVPTLISKLEVSFLDKLFQFDTSPCYKNSFEVIINDIKKIGDLSNTFPMIPNSSQPTKQDIAARYFQKTIGSIKNNLTELRETNNIFPSN